MTRPMHAWMLVLLIGVFANGWAELTAQAPSPAPAANSEKPPTDTAQPARDDAAPSATNAQKDAPATTAEEQRAASPAPISLASRIAGWTALAVTTGILLLFAYLTFLLVNRFTKALDSRLALGTRSHWGGFGGGEGGWELSPALAMLLAVAILSIATAALGMAVADAGARLLDERPPAPAPTDSPAAAGSNAAEKPAAPAR